MHFGDRLFAFSVINCINSFFFWVIFHVWVFIIIIFVNFNYPLIIFSLICIIFINFFDPEFTGQLWFFQLMLNVTNELKHCLACILTNLGYYIVCLSTDECHWFFDFSCLVSILPQVFIIFVYEAIMLFPITRLFFLLLKQGLNQLALILSKDHPSWYFLLCVSHLN